MARVASSDLAAWHGMRACHDTLFSLALEKKNKETRNKKANVQFWRCCSCWLGFWGPAPHQHEKLLFQGIQKVLVRTCKATLHLSSLHRFKNPLWLEAKVACLCGVKIEHAMLPKTMQCYFSRFVETCLDPGNRFQAIRLWKNLQLTSDDRWEKMTKQQLINEKYRCKAIDDDDDDEEEEDDDDDDESSGNLHKSTVWLTSEVAKRSTPSPSSTVSASNTHPSASKRCTSASNGDVIGIFYLCSIEMIEENCLKEVAKIHLSNGSFINSQSCLRAENGEFSGVCLESPTEKGCCKKSWSVVVAMNHGGFCPLAICHRSTQPPWAYNLLDHPSCTFTCTCAIGTWWHVICTYVMYMHFLQNDIMHFGVYLP